MDPVTHKHPPYLFSNKKTWGSMGGPPSQNQMGGGESDSLQPMWWDRSTLLHHSQVTQKILCVTIINAAWSQETLFQKRKDSFSHSLSGSGSRIDIKLGWLKIEGEEGCMSVWLLWTNKCTPLPLVDWSSTESNLLFLKWNFQCNKETAC